MKKYSLSIMILLLSLLTGCHGDYLVELPNDYELAAASAHIVEVNYIGELESNNLDPEFGHIPAKVVELGYNEQYIIAKQYGLKEAYPKDPNNSYLIPDETKAYYWILDTINKERYGPYETKEEFNQKRKEFGIENIKMKSPDSYEKKKEEDYLKDYKFGNDVYITENFKRNETWADYTEIGSGTVINFADNIIRYKQNKEKNLLYIVCVDKEKLDSGYIYIIINYKTQKIRKYHSLEELDINDRKIFETKKGFKKTVNSFSK